MKEGKRDEEDRDEERRGIKGRRGKDAGRGWSRCFFAAFCGGLALNAQCSMRTPLGFEIVWTSVAGARAPRIEGPKEQRRRPTQKNPGRPAQKWTVGAV